MATGRDVYGEAWMNFAPCPDLIPPDPSKYYDDEVTPENVKSAVKELVNLQETRYFQKIPPEEYSEFQEKITPRMMYFMNTAMNVFKHDRNGVNKGNAFIILVRN